MFDLHGRKSDEYQGNINIWDNGNGGNSQEDSQV
jgi:hypothetical protein